MVRRFFVIASLFSLVACKNAPRPEEQKDVHDRECAALLSRLETINHSSSEFGVANKADGGTLVDMWRGYARMAQADAQKPLQSTNSKILQLEKRLVEIRGRSGVAFVTVADATERGDKKAGTHEVHQLGNEWKDLQNTLRAGCP